MFNSNKGKEPSSQSFSEFDDKLANDNNGSFQKEVKAKLDEYHNAVKSKMTSGGLKPSEFEVAEKLLKGIDSAHKIINKMTQK